MKKLLAIGVLLLLLALAAMFVFFGGVQQEVSVDASTAQTTAAMDEAAPLTPLDVQVEKNDDDLLVFDCTLDDFIASYNGFYWQDAGTRYLRPADDWRADAVEETVHADKPATQYITSADPDRWTLPQMNVFIPEGETRIEQVAVTYDDHSYSEATYALYEEDCFYTLKVFFPDLDDEVLRETVQTLNQTAYDHTFLSKQQYRPGKAQRPAMLYHRDGIGVFAYFAIGAPLHFCIIPVDDALIDDLTANGSDVRTLP